MFKEKKSMSGDRGQGEHGGWGRRAVSTEMLLAAPLRRGDPRKGRRDVGKLAMSIWAEG